MKCHNVILKSMLFLVILAPMLSSCSCGGGSSSASQPASSSPTTEPDPQPPAPTGYVEGTLYTPDLVSAARAAQDSFTTTYVPLRNADVSVACGSATKTGATDDNGYFKIQDAPVGSCTLTAANSSGYDFAKEIQITENQGTKTAWTVDGHLLGRVLLEDRDTHAGTTVTITAGGQAQTVQADANGYYVMPDLQAQDNSDILIEAQNSCDFFLPNDSYINTGSVENDLIPDISLLQLFRHTVSTDKKEYSFSENNSIEICLDIDYRGLDSFTFECYSSMGHLLLTHIEKSITYSKSDSHPIETVWVLSPNETISRCFVVSMDELSRTGSGYYEAYMTLCNESASACARKDQFSFPVNVAYFSIK